jgi:hypothetical protein
MTSRSRRIRHGRKVLMEVVAEEAVEEDREVVEEVVDSEAEGGVGGFKRIVMNMGEKAFRDKMNRMTGREVFEEAILVSNLRELRQVIL